MKALSILPVSIFLGCTTAVPLRTEVLPVQIYCDYVHIPKIEYKPVKPIPLRYYVNDDGIIEDLKAETMVDILNKLNTINSNFDKSIQVNEYLSRKLDNHNKTCSPKEK